MAKMTVPTYEHYPFELLNIYAGVDCIVTSELLAKLFPKVAEKPRYALSINGNRQYTHAPSLLWENNHVKMPVYEFLIDLEVNGFQFDKDKNAELKEAMASEIAELDRKIFPALGEVINLNSGPELREILYKKFKWKAPFQTKSGDDSVDGDALRALYKIHNHSWLLDLAKRRDIASVYSSFVDTYVETWVKSDGRIHPQYNATGTSSHRPSSESPNLLNLPRMCHDYNIRSQFTVRDGMVFMAFDFSSCEVKILGALSKDPLLLQAIREGKDFHSFTACLIHGLDYDEYVAIRKDEDHPKHKEYVELRQQAKAVTLNYLRPLAAMLIEKLCEFGETLTRLCWRQSRAKLMSLGI